jgi:hypothetical protein
MKLFLYDCSFSWLPVAYAYSSSTWGNGSGGSWFKASPGNYFMRPHWQKKTKQNGLEVWLKPQAWSPKFKTQSHKKDVRLHTIVRIIMHLGLLPLYLISSNDNILPNISQFHNHGTYLKIANFQTTSSPQALSVSFL